MIKFPNLLGIGRSARAARTASVSTIARGLSLLSTIILVPLLLNHLGTERFGLWMTLSVLFIYLKAADGGVTIGLIGLVATADGAQDSARVRTLVSSAFIVTVVVALVLLIGALSAALMDWSFVLNLSDPSIQTEAALVAAIFIAAIALGYPVGVAKQSRMGLQQGAAANLWDLGGAVVAFLGQLAVVFFGGGLVMLAMVFALTPVLFNALAAVCFWTGSGRLVSPSPALANFATAKTLFASGAMFTALTLTQAFAVQLDSVLIARVLGVEHVAVYAVVQKLMTQPMLFITLFLTAQFPAYSEALSRGDDAWIIRNLRQTLIATSALAAAAAAGLSFIAGPLIHLWTGDAVEPSSRLILALAVYGAVAALANVFTYFFFSLGLYRRVIVAHVAMIAINIPLALLLIPLIGPEGAAIANTIGYLATLVIPSLLALPSVLSDLDRLRARAQSRALTQAQS